MGYCALKTIEIRPHLDEKPPRGSIVIIIVTQYRDLYRNISILILNCLGPVG